MLSLASHWSNRSPRLVQPRLHRLPRRLVKAGVLPKRHQPRYTLVSAWAELVGYSGSLTLSALAVLACLQKEALIRQRIAQVTGPTFIFD